MHFLHVGLAQAHQSTEGRIADQSSQRILSLSVKWPLPLLAVQCGVPHFLKALRLCVCVVDSS